MRSMVLDVISCLVTVGSGVIVTVGLSLDCNVSKLGGPFCESILLIMLYMLLFINEGYQIGLISIKELTTTTTTTTTTVMLTSDDVLVNNLQAKKIIDLIFADSRDNLPKLFIGHSCISVFCMTLISQLTTFKSFPSIPFISDRITSLLIRSGVPGIIFTINVFQLLPTLIAQMYPISFLNYTPFIHMIVTTALAIESTGIAQFSFVLIRLLEFLYFKRVSTAVGLLNDSDDTDLSGDNNQLSGGELDYHCDNWSAISLLKTVISGMLFIVSLVFICTCLVMGYSGIPISGGVLIIVLFVAYTINFYCEGK